MGQMMGHACYPGCANHVCHAFGPGADCAYCFCGHFVQCILSAVGISPPMDFFPLQSLLAAVLEGWLEGLGMEDWAFAAG